MSNYETQLEAINLKYGVQGRQVYGGIQEAGVKTTKTNEYLYRKLKNKIHYGFYLEALLNQGIKHNGEW